MVWHILTTFRRTQRILTSRKFSGLGPDFDEQKTGRNANKHYVKLENIT